MRRAVIERAAFPSELGKNVLVLGNSILSITGLKARCKNCRYVALDLVELFRKHFDTPQIHFRRCWQGWKFPSSVAPLHRLQRGIQASSGRMKRGGTWPWLRNGSELAPWRSTVEREVTTMHRSELLTH